MRTIVIENVVAADTVIPMDKIVCVCPPKEENTLIVVEYKISEHVSTEIDLNYESTVIRDRVFSHYAHWVNNPELKLGETWTFYLGRRHEA